MSKKQPVRFLEDVPRPSAMSVMEAFYGGDQPRRTARELPLEQIDPNPQQPRRSFNNEDLTSLTESIRELGLIQAILVRPIGDRYEIVCGERRYRACKALGHKAIRAEVRDIDAITAYKLALAENVQRDSLSPIEEAFGYQRLLDEGMAQAEIARTLGIDRRRVSDKLLLLRLPPATQELLSARADNFSERHARLLAQAEVADVDAMARRCVENAWSTRRLESEIARATSEAVAEARLFENLRYSLNKRGGFTLMARARSRQEVARTIAYLEEKLAELRGAFSPELSARADDTAQPSADPSPIA